MTAAPTRFRSRQTPARGSRGGFTLIEILLVLVITALLAATASSQYSSAINNFGADALARRVAMDLAYAQSIARRTGAIQAVSFDVANNQYTLVGFTDPDKPSTTYGLTCSTEPYRGSIATLSLLSGATTVTQVNFDQYGFPDAGGTIVVQVGSTQRTVTLSAASGKTTVQ